MASNPSHPHGIDPVESWNQNADYWDQGVGASGNMYWSKLQEPCLQKFLGEHLQRENCQALEFATGNGLCARWMAERGARVLATDGAPTMLEKAKGRGSAEGRIEFQKVDVTSDEELDVLVQGGNTFDIILMNMAIMDVATLDPLARALPKLLKKDGVFAATILHPVFMTSIYSRTAESKFDPVTLDYKLQIGKNISEYLFVEPYKTVALIGQDGPQLFFHRPIHEICSTFFRAGLVMDGFEEPSFKEGDGDPTRMLSTANFTQLPAIMGFRMRLMGN